MSTTEIGDCLCEALEWGWRSVMHRSMTVSQHPWKCPPWGSYGVTRAEGSWIGVGPVKATPHGPTEDSPDWTDRVSCLGNAEIGGLAQTGPNPTWGRGELDRVRPLHHRWCDTQWALLKLVSEAIAPLTGFSCEAILVSHNKTHHTPT
jgi:hypothetical protein